MLFWNGILSFSYPPSLHFPTPNACTRLADHAFLAEVQRLIFAVPWRQYFLLEIEFRGGLDVTASFLVVLEFAFCWGGAALTRAARFARAFLPRYVIGAGTEHHSKAREEGTNATDTVERRCAEE